MAEEKSEGGGNNFNNKESNKKGIKECVEGLSERLRGCKSEKEVLERLKAEISEGLNREADKIVREIEVD